MNVYGVDHIVVKCSDIEASLRWYRDQLGLREERVGEWRAGSAPFPSVRVSDDFVIDLFDASPSGSNLDHFCLVTARETVDAVAGDDRFDVVDGPGERWGAHGVGWSVYVTDPDGNVVELRSYD